MAREFSYRLYHSSAWIQTREAYVQTQHGICEWCGGIGDTVHHTPTLTPQTIDDPELTLGWNHLTLLCRDCHALAHAEIKSCAPGSHFDADGNLVGDAPRGDIVNF